MSLSNKSKKLLSLALCLYKIRRKRKRMWVQPYFLKRTDEGQGTFYNIVSEMRLTSTESFVEFFRVTPDQFEYLLSLVEVKISPCDVTFREVISARDRLAVTLRYLASGQNLKHMSRTFRISSSCLSRMVFVVCLALGEALAPVVMPAPDASSWEKVAEQMNSSFQFPNCAGAIGGKFIKQANTQGDVKGPEKVTFLAVCDADLKFVITDIANYTTEKNSIEFRSTALGKAIEGDRLELPPPVQLSGMSEKVPYVFAGGDHRFPLMQNLMKPYLGAGDPEEGIFDYRLSRCANLIDNAFGVMSSRFLLLSRPINSKTTTVQAIVMATACLHNYLLTDENENAVGPKFYCPEGYCDREGPDGTLLKGDWRSAVEGQQVAMTDISPSYVIREQKPNLRDGLKTYFCGAGAVPWQMERVTASDQS